MNKIGENAQKIKEIQEKAQAKIEEERQKFELSKDPSSRFTEGEIHKALKSEQDGDAWLFIRVYRDRLCYDHAARRWYEWKGHYWEEDLIEEVLAALEALVEIYAKEASRWSWVALKAARENNTEGRKTAELKEHQFLKKISVIQKTSWKHGVLTMAAAGRRSLAITGQEWDRDPWLLGCGNGVIELKTGAFRAGRQSDYIKTLSPTAWKGINESAPTWEKFISEIFNGSQDLAAYIQRLLGYSITGVTREDVFPIFWGQGRNGKGTMLETLQFVLGPLARPVKSELLLDQSRIRPSNAPDPDLMSLRGLRIAWASETGEGGRLNEGKAKILSGSDTIAARPPYARSEVSFPPTHNVFLLTNYKPKANPNDYALWNRIHLVPFTVSFVDNPRSPNERKKDHELKTKLCAEAPGILAWLVRGCLEWQKQRLNPPEIVKQATAQYREGEDDIGRFISECCVIDRRATVKAGKLYEAYETWCKELGLAKNSGRRFGSSIKERFDVTPRTSSGIYYLGIGLLNEESSEQ